LERRQGGLTCIKAVAMITPLPKNLATIKAVLGIFKAGTRFERTGKNAPTTQLVSLRSFKGVL